jgi:UDP-GlcNAc:undecaprenyl-phosphate GlcNAc-1-phosphate transferase
VPVVQRLAFRFDILDHPKSRKIHKRPMPKLGGLAMYLAFVVGVLANCDYNEQLKGILVGSTIVLFIGLMEDIKHIRASIRLAFQLLACVITIAHGVVIKVFPWYILNVIVTVIGIIGITNALNFLDNMDGLAAGIAAICAFGIAATAYKSDQWWLEYLSLSLFGAILGFLRYNFKPAKIFMGDSGSTFLGFTIASLCIMSNWSQYKIVAVTIPVLIMGIMIFDTTMITVLRIVEGKVRTFRQWLEHADTDHISHRLSDMGLSQRETVMFLYISNLILVGVAIVLPKDGVKSCLFAFAGFCLVVIWAIWRLHRIKITKYRIG